MRSTGFHLAIAVWLLGGSLNAADWQAVTTELIAKEKPGYGGVSGVVVDHTNGHVYLCLSDRGIFRSTDQGKTWEHFGKGAFKGRTEWPGCLLLDPTEKTHRLLVALVYGIPITLGDGGEWRTLGKESAHVDYAAVDWSDPHRSLVLTLKHESDGKLLVSQNGGKTFREAGNGFGAAWVFDDKTAVIAEIKAKGVAGGHLLRTTDGGKTFQSIGNYEIKSVPKWHDGALYWLMSGALYRTMDKGEKWQKLSDVKDARYGPIFGKDAKQLFVLTGAGVVESRDGGQTWLQPLAPPKELKGISALTWLEYDPVSDTLYLMKMGSDLYKMSRK